MPPTKTDNDPFHYPDDDEHVDGVANLIADSKNTIYEGKKRQRRASHKDKDISGKMVTGTAAAAAAAAQPRLIHERTAHQRVSCWKCGSKDVGWDPMRKRWSCITHERD